MGYRTKLGILDKLTHVVIKDMTIAELRKWHGDNDYVPCYEITKEVYELGKYYDPEFLKPFACLVFSKPETNAYYNEDTEFYIISKEGFEAIIESYRKHVLEYYESALKPPTSYDEITGNVVTPQKIVEAKIRAWGENCTKAKLYPYNLKGEEITTSWEYEYSIFELVRIYKSVDWENQLVTITAW